MNKIIMSICLVACISFSSCKKDEFNGVSTSHAPIPVTVSNLFGIYNGVPTVSASISGGGTLTISLSIPAGTGRSIKEITKVGVATTPSNFKVVQIATGLYNTAPIPGSGTSVTFTTSLAEFTAKTGIAVTASGTATSFLSRYFMFLVTLDNGDTIYPVGVRIYVAS